MHGFIPCKAFENNRIFDMIQVGEDYYIGSLKGLIKINLPTGNLKNTAVLYRVIRS